MSRACPHVGSIREVETPTLECPECVAMGDRWVHLRQCMTCGAVGCCNSSKNKHSSKHAAATDHPIARSIEPGERWMWCYVDEEFVRPEG